MTSQSPRIYIYKITFEEVPYYYYGVHKEEKYNEYYMGSPVTNKWCWELYTPKKQILQLFDFTDEGWLEAQEVEKRLIKPFYNTDKWCLNENVGGTFSLEQKRKAGKIGGRKVVEYGLGCHSLTIEEKSEIGKLGGTKAYEMGVGVHRLTLDEKIEIGKLGGTKTYEMGVGIFGRSQGKMEEDCRKGGKKCKELGVGIFSMSLEEKRRIAKINCENGIGFASATKEERIERSRKGGKKTNTQKWVCLETDYISTPAGLSHYQKARGIDTSKRRKIS